MEFRVTRAALISLFFLASPNVIRVTSIKTFCKDLGIFISEDSTVRKHCANIVRTAYLKIKQFNLSFVCQDINFKVFIYKTYIRPLHESNAQLWAPHLLQDIDMVERIRYIDMSNMVELCLTR